MGRASLLGHAKNKRREKEAADWNAEDYGTFEMDHVGDNRLVDSIYIR